MPVLTRVPEPQTPIVSPKDLYQLIVFPEAPPTAVRTVVVSSLHLVPTPVIEVNGVGAGITVTTVDVQFE